MRPWKSKAGRPLVNPAGNPPANSGFLLGRSMEDRDGRAAGRTGRGCWRPFSSLWSLRGGKICSDDGGGGEKLDDGAPRCEWVIGSPDCSCCGRRNEDECWMGGRCRGTPVCCLEVGPLLERDPGRGKSTCRFCWLMFLCGTTGTWIGRPAGTLLPT